ncbi:hypothetical protein COOONC_06387, partial [Cooperia oncophora]
MTESDDGSFFDEPVFRGAAGEEEPESQALDFGDEALEIGSGDRNVEESQDDNSDSPFIAQMPVTPPPVSHLLNEQPAPSTTPSKIAQFASRMGMIPPKVQKPSNVTDVVMDDDEQRPTSTVTKRSAKITLSPTKAIKRKRFVYVWNSTLFLQKCCLIASESFRSIGPSR